MKKLAFIFFFMLPLTVMSQSETSEPTQSESESADLLTEGAVVLIHSEPGLENYILPPKNEQSLNVLRQLNNAEVDPRNVLFVRTNGEEDDGQQYRAVNLELSSVDRGDFSNPSCVYREGRNKFCLLGRGGLGGHARITFGPSSDSNGNR